MFNKNKMRKKIIITVVIGMVLLFINTPIFGLWISSKWGHAAEYNEYSEEFNIVKDFLLEKYGDDVDKGFSIKKETESASYLYDYNEGELLECDEEVARAIATIKTDGFPDGENGLDYIDLYSGKVIFSTDNGSYALAYWPIGLPTTYCLPGQSCMVCSLPLGDGWYHVTP